MRIGVTSLIAAGVLVVGVAALLDALRGSPPQSEPAVRNPYVAPSPAPAAAAADRLPTCTTRQLRLSIKVLGGLASVVVRHVSGDPCRLPRLLLRVSVRDQAGREVLLRNPEGLEGSFQRFPVRGDFRPGFEQLIPITFSSCYPETAPAGRYYALARGGPYLAHRYISGAEIGCIGG